MKALIVPHRIDYTWLVVVLDDTGLVLREVYFVTLKQALYYASLVESYNEF